MQHHPTPKKIDDTSEKPAPESTTTEAIRVIADRSLVLALLVAGVVVVLQGDDETARLLFAGFLGMVAPLSSRTPPGAARILPLGLGLGAALAFSSCGGPQLTADQRTALAIETQRCIVNERAIVDRVGSSREDDERDLAAERARCDAARDAIANGGTP